MGKKKPTTPAQDLYRQFVALPDDDKLTFWKLLEAHLDDAPHIKAIAQILIPARSPVFLPLAIAQCAQGAGSQFWDALAALLEVIRELRAAEEKRNPEPMKGLVKRMKLMRLPAMLDENTWKRTKGMSYEEIARALNLRGEKNSRGGKWTGTAVRKLLARHE